MIAQQTPAKPFTLTVDARGIPSELATLPQWVGWRWELTKDGAWSKLPKDPNSGRNASTIDPRTWSTFDHALSTAERRGWDGIGFVFTEDDPYFGIDLDDGFHDDGKLRPETLALIHRFGTYCEPSVRMQGVHLIGRATAFPHTGSGNKAGTVECYWSRRFFTVTGRPLLGYHGPANCTTELRRWHAETFPPAVITAMRPPPRTMSVDDQEALARARKLPGFVALYDGGDAGEYGGDESRAEWHLINDLIRAGVTEPGQLDRLYRGSGLSRGKWEERRGHQTYGEYTIERALNGGALPFAGWQPKEEAKHGERPGNGHVDRAGAGRAAATAGTGGTAVDRGGSDPGATDGGAGLDGAGERAPGVKTGANIKERHLDSFGFASCAACAAKDRENAELRRQLDEERVARQALQARLDGLSRVQSLDAAVRRNKAIGQKRMTAVALGHLFASREAAGEAGEDGRYHVSLAGLSESAGNSAQTASSHLQDLADAGLITKQLRRIPGYVDTETGEIIETKNQLWIGPAAGTAIDFMQAAAELAPEQERTWGGKRVACPEHPEAGTVKRWTIHCQECDQVLEADEEVHTQPTFAATGYPSSDTVRNTVQANVNVLNAVSDRNLGKPMHAPAPAATGIAGAWMRGDAMPGAPGRRDGDGAGTQEDGM